MMAAESRAQQLRLPFVWFWEFLKEELAPFPGRGGIVARMVIASTLMMIITMVFRLPYGAYSAFYVFQLSREGQRAAIRSARTIVTAFGASAAVALIGAMLVLGDPGLRLLWVIATLFLMFYAVRTLTSYGASLRFGYLLAIVIPVFDHPISAEAKVEQTLWAAFVMILATGVALWVELLLVKLTEEADLSGLLDRRLARVEDLLHAYVQGRSPDAEKKELAQFSTLGTSRLRNILQRSPYSRHYREQMGAVVGLTGNLINLGVESTPCNLSDPERVQALAVNIGRIRADLLNGRTRQPTPLNENAFSSDSDLLLKRMENTVSLIDEMLIARQSLSGYELQESKKEQASRFLVPDALSNPEHLRFALKGCLAASLCYLTYNLIGWPGISTAIITCFLTALTTTGASHQKQTLLLAGAAAGGLLGVASQLFILPHIDSIAGFTTWFIVVTIPAAWFVTCTPRLSYFGLQVAFAYNFVNLQEFTIQTSLTPARDRIAGILLGLFMMWLIFDRLWGTPAAVAMKTGFVSALRQMAQFAREPISENLPTAIERGYSLRDEIEKGFENLRARADQVLFEFGPSREWNLALRDRIRQWQPQLRVLFVLLISTWNYRLRLPGFDLPDSIHSAQREFDEKFARILEGMANAIDGNPAELQDNFGNSLQHLEQSVESYAATEPQTTLATGLRTYLAQNRTIRAVTWTLLQETSSWVARG
jgi:multidrug resistance protein MdtO